MTARFKVFINTIDFIVGVAPYNSTIVVDFIPKGDAVKMIVTLSPMHNEMFTRMQLEGFTSQLTKLNTRFGLSAQQA